MSGPGTTSPSSDDPEPAPPIAAATASDFLALATRGRVLNENRAAELKARLRRRASAADIAQQLIIDGELTAFQAKKLLSGRWQGLIVGRYRILKPIGRGGMGVVYLAEDMNATGRKPRVALKILPPRKAAAEPRTRARFLREVAIGRELPNATNIARVLETGIADGIAFIAMEYVPGRTVRAVVGKQGPLPVGAAARIFSGVALGLAATHDKGFIHRDVKPSNIMITADGTAKLVDFGFAFRIGEPAGDPGVVGGAGYTLGTFDFIPPEQAANAAAVTPQADQYSLGCSLYYALAGQPPFPGGNPKEKMQKHRWEDPEPLVELRPDLPAEFAAIVTRLMVKTPNERFASCHVLAKVLQTWANSPAETANYFEEDEFEIVDDDLDQLAAFNSTTVRQRAYRLPRSTILAVVGLSVVVLILLSILIYLLAR